MVSSNPHATRMRKWRAANPNKVAEHDRTRAAKRAALNRLADRHRGEYEELVRRELRRLTRPHLVPPPAEDTA